MERDEFLKKLKDTYKDQKIERNEWGKRPPTAQELEAVVRKPQPHGKGK